MGGKSDEFRKKLLLTFRAEAEEHIKALTAGLIDLEKGLPDEAEMKVIETVFREMHSMKGAARSVGISDVEGICQSAESVFSALKRRDIGFHPVLFDTLHRVVDMISAIVFSPEGTPGIEAGKISDIKAQLKRIEAGELPPEPGPSRPAVNKEAVSAGQISQPAETVRIATQKMAGLMLEVEELIAAKLVVAQHLDDITGILLMFDEWNREWSKKYAELRDFIRGQEKKAHSGHNGAKDDMQGMRMLEFLDVTRKHTRSIEGRLAGLKKQAQRDRYRVGTMIDNLLEDVKKTLMVPFSSLFETFPKIIRDLSREQGKETTLTVKGGEIEIDRRILEEIKPPFIHLIRNSVDHGLEKPDERLQRSKPQAGNIRIAVSNVEGNKVEMVFSDDGIGLDIKKLRTASAGREAAPETDERSDEEILDSIFESGISTSPIITDISGRGLGLAIVKEKITQLGGHISVESSHGEGTSFRIVVPLSLATLRGVIVKTAGKNFIVPTINVERVLRIAKDEIRTVENRETVLLKGRTLTLVWLADILELPRAQDVPPLLQIVVLGSSGKLTGFVVDEVLNEQEVLTKKSNYYLSRVRNIAGTTILGSGEVVPILNVADLMRAAARPVSLSIKTGITQAMKEEQSILVVEDSITSRMLLRNVLEAAGYHVETAVDGVDAITRLKTERFDLVVSDVDMPRMNGFDLTSKIRSDKKMAEIPVVLVTALESRADKERGIDVGANAYIVKKDFGKTNLLGIIEKLL